jgi:hypothetical protein
MRIIKEGTCRPWCGGMDPGCPVHGQSSNVAILRHCPKHGLVNTVIKEKIVERQGGKEGLRKLRVCKECGRMVYDKPFERRGKIVQIKEE